MWRRALLACAWLLYACSRADESSDRSAALRGSVAAVVNGEAIALAEVEQLVARAAIAPEQALRRLVAERLLAQHAKERGYEHSPRVEQETERALVRAVLEDELEAKLPAEDRAAREQHLGQWLLALKRRTPIAYDEAAIASALREPADVPSP